MYSDEYMWIYTQRWFQFYSLNTIKRALPCIGVFVHVA